MTNNNAATAQVCIIHSARDLRIEPVPLEPLRPQQVRRVENAGCAVHHVLERVDISTAEGTQTAWVLATNVFFKTTQGWRLVLHHASPGSPREAQEIVADAPSTLH